MSILGGRGGRSDDWSTQHARAQARAAERLDGALDPDEAIWLDEHLAACAECAATATQYASQRLELRALRDRMPVPPRDLWARTAASIEQEARHRALQPRVQRRTVLAPFALVAGAVVVAVVVGNLSSSQDPGIATGGTPAATGGAPATLSAPSAAATPLVVAQQITYLSLSRDGRYHVNTTQISEVCPEEVGTCATTEPSEVVTLGPLASPETVFGSGDAPLVVLGDTPNGSSVFAVDIPRDTSGGPSPTPDQPTPTAPPQSPTPAVDPSAPTESPPVGSPPPTEPPPTDPPTPPGTVEIARGVEVVDTTAAYAPDGSAFAFTARPADGSHGPDIYLWTVGDTLARPITTDHRSVFGSWAGDKIVGSTVVTSNDGANEPVAFVLGTDGDEPVLLPETGLAWRPVVDPTSGAAVYWAGALEPTPDRLGWRTENGRLVVGRWTAGADGAGEPRATQLTGNQEAERSETTIAEGPLADWDARWDETGTRLAVWVADEADPTVGKLSLYVVDPFDGRIDLANPPLLDEPAHAGFSIADGRLAWAAPAGNTDKTSRVLVLAWTDKGFGQVESAPGDFLLVR